MAMRNRRGIESASVVVGLLLIALIVGAFYISIFPKRIMSGADTMDKERKKAGDAVEPSFIDNLFSKLGGSSCGGTYTKTVKKEDGSEEIKSTCKESMCEQTSGCVCIETGADIGKCVERTPSGGSGTCSGINGRCMESAECTGAYKSMAASATGCGTGLVCCMTCASNVVDAKKNLRAVCRSSCLAKDKVDASRTYGCDYGMEADSYTCCKTTG